MFKSCGLRDAATMAETVIKPVDTSAAISSTGAFGQVWRQQSAKVGKAYKLHMQGGDAEAGRRVRMSPTASSTISLSTQNERRSRAQTSLGINAPSTPKLEELRQPSSVETPRTPTYTELAAPLVQASPGSDEPLEQVFARLDTSGDGVLQRVEVGQMLALLRAQATESSSDEHWLQPCAEEVDDAMAAMDSDGDGVVSFREFSRWWKRKNKNGAFASSPAMWGVQSEGSSAGDEDEEDEEEEEQEEQAESQSEPNGNLQTKMESGRQAWTPEREALLPAAAGGDASGQTGSDRPSGGDADDDEIERLRRDREIARIFHSLDADGSGALEWPEVSSLLAHLRAKATDSETVSDWHVPSEEETDAAMMAMDSNGDCQVTLDEFRAWWEAKGGWDYAEDPGLWDA